jgi:amino acid permease
MHLLKGFATAVYALIGTAGYLMFGNDVFDEVTSSFFKYSSFYLTRKRLLAQSEPASRAWVQPGVEQAGTLDACCDTLVR